MATWHFSGGVKVIEIGMGLHVTGAGELADALRFDLASLARKESPPVSVHGAYWIDLDLESLWLVNRWLEHKARRYGEAVTTDVPREALVPPEAALKMLLEEKEPPGSLH